MRGQIDRAHAALTEQALKAVLIIENLTDVVFERCHRNGIRFSLAQAFTPGKKIWSCSVCESPINGASAQYIASFPGVNA